MESYSAQVVVPDIHRTDDQLIRFLRDRRLRLAIGDLRHHLTSERTVTSVLIVCGGAGGEGTFFANNGFPDVTVSDLSESSLKQCQLQDSRLTVSRQNAEALDFANDSFDLVVVQDGLHHLTRPHLGLTEMLRVARVAVIVVEPHYGLAGRLLGREYEVLHDERNYVYRWSKETFLQTVRSLTPYGRPQVHVRRLWDHGLLVSKLVKHMPQSTQRPLARLIYCALRPFSFGGNMFIGLALLD